MIRAARNAAASARTHATASAPRAAPHSPLALARSLQSRASLDLPGGRNGARKELTLLVTRSFATQSTATDAGYELLKKDFRKWLKKEAQILSLLMLVGVTGVYFYKNRESAPSNKVLKLLAQAEQSAKEEDRQGALKHCLHAYSITKVTNSQDRHLFELAFAIAAQYETLGKVNQATLYYQEALGNIPYVRDAAKRDMNRVVTLDRIAQCYQDKGEQGTAEKYYKQAVSVYDTSRASRPAGSTDVEPIDREIPAVLYNYGQQLMHLTRWEEANHYLKRSLALANSSRLPEENTAKIETMLLDVSSAIQDLADGDDSIAE